MPSFKKRIPPPPRQPGTHTNAEVKEALHARALRRTIVVAAVVILLLAALAVVYSSAREYTDATPTRTPRMVLIVAPDMTPEALTSAMSAGKAPFIRLLSSAGALKGELQTPTVSGSRLVQLLTASSTATAANLVGLTSFLRTLKTNGFKPLIAAPSAWWSGSTASTSTSTTCAKTGLYDTECSGLACPTETATAYCNAFRKFVTCDNPTELYKYQVIEAFTQGLTTGSDLIYVQVPGLNIESETVTNTLETQSNINLLDNAIGQIATTIVQRTQYVAENWNIMLVGATGNTKTNQVPFFTIVYTKGGLVQLQSSLPSSASTTDVRNTVLQWFNTDTSNLDTTRLLGICSKGSVVQNCK